jgi:hypothetical protein
VEVCLYVHDWQEDVQKDVLKVFKVGEVSAVVFLPGGLEGVVGGVSCQGSRTGLAPAIACPPPATPVAGAAPLRGLPRAALPRRRGRTRRGRRAGGEEVVLAVEEPPSKAADAEPAAKAEPAPAVEEKPTAAAPVDAKLEPAPAVEEKPAAAASEDAKAVPGSAAEEQPADAPAAVVSVADVLIHYGPEMAEFIAKWEAYQKEAPAWHARREASFRENG